MKDRRIKTIAIIAVMAALMWIGRGHIVGIPRWLHALGFQDWLKQFDPIDRYITATGAVLIGAYAVFHETLWSWIRRPILQVHFQPKPPYYTFMPLFAKGPGSEIFKDSVPSLQVRLKVTNAGKDRAEQVEVYARALARKQGDVYVDENWFLPMNLRWAHQESPDLQLMIYTALSENIDRLCNVAQICRPGSYTQVGAVGHAPEEFNYGEKCFLKLHTAVDSSNNSNVIFPGFYRLDLTVSASNAKSQSVSLYFDFDGSWFGEEQQTLSEHFHSRLDSHPS